MTKRVLVIGDSHACFWSGKNQLTIQGVDPRLVILQIGPATAHNLIEDHTTTRAKEIVTDYLDRERELYGAIVCCFGEIDCRTHIVREASRSGRPLAEVAQATLKRYLTFIEYLIDRYKLPCIAWGPIASSPPHKFSYNPEFPAVGTIWERNYATQILNDGLREAAAGNPLMGHISVFQQMLDVNNVTIADFLYDGCHLMNTMFSPALRLLDAEMRHLGAEVDLRFANHWQVSGPGTLINVARGLRFEQSTVWGSSQSAALSDLPNGAMKFHTDLEPNPWIMIELDSGYVISSIEIYNRVTECAERAATIAVDISPDKENWQTVFKASPGHFPFDAQGRLAIPCSWPKPTRFVKVYLQERQYLHLDTVRILVPQFVQSVAA